MRALVCGAGIAGLTTAGLLARSGWDVDLVEHSPTPRGGGYMTDFCGPGYAAAEAIGLLPRLQEKAYVVPEAVHVERSGRCTATLDYEQMRQALGGRLLSLLRGDLEAALRDGLLQTPTITQLFGVSVEEVLPHDTGVTVTTTDGNHHDVDLLVGADGIHSRVRELVFGPERGHLRYLGFHTAAYLFEDPDVHDRLGGRFVLTDSMDHQMGLYGLRDGRVAVFAAHRSPDPALPVDRREALRSRYADLGWVVPDVLEHCPEPPDLYYDQVAQVHIADWVEGRVALVGDSCQAVSLLAGQGASLALAGAHVLAEELHHADSLHAGLQRYQDRMKPVALGSQEAGRRAAEWFLPSSRRRLLLRRWTLRLMRLPGIDRRLANSLVGNIGPVP